MAKKTIAKNCLGVTQLNYSSRHFNLAKASCEQLIEAMHLSDALQMRITGILGSDLIKGALDQKFILEKMKGLSARREAILSLVRTNSY